MKKLVLSAALLAFAAQSFAQDVLYDAKIKKEEVPVVIIESIETDFPGFVLDEFKAIPLEFVEEDVIVNKNIASLDDYETFEITLSGKGKLLEATYDRSGKLLSTKEHMKNVAPPVAVRQAISKAYPGWTLAKDTYYMTHHGKGKARERYRLELIKGNEKMHVYTDANGKILNMPKMHKTHKM